MRLTLMTLLTLILPTLLFAQQDSLYIDFTDFNDEGYPIESIQEISFSGSIQDSILLTLSNNSQQKYSIASISELTFHAPQGYTVPVELVNFSGRLEGFTIYLNWNTASEINNAGFEVQQLTAKDWQKIGFVAGKGTTTIGQSYSFETTATTNSLRFRLKQLDLDGSFTYSKILVIDAVPYSFSVSQNYPNPFNPSTNISFQIPSAGKVRIVLFDMLGRRIQKVETPELSAGMHQYELKAGSLGLSSGIYFLQLTFGNTTIQKKINLLK